MAPVKLVSGFTLSRPVTKTLVLPSTSRQARATNKAKAASITVLIALLLALTALSAGSLAHAMSVVFLNPGTLDEPYWNDVDLAMSMAAQSLGVELETIHLERDHTRVPYLLDEILTRPESDRPDYILLSNDYGTAPAALEHIAATHPTPVFLTLSGLHGPARQAAGAPRENFPFWLGSLEPRAQDAGYQTAMQLFAAARALDLPRGPDGHLHLLAFSGDRSTPTSIARNQGLAQALAESPDIVLDQMVHAAWQYDKAVQQAEWLYQRHPHARLIWSGNDQMALAAMQVWRERGGQPGQDAVFSAINTSPAIMAALRDGSLSTLSGGHFIGGAISLVMLYDYHHGHDFAVNGLEQEIPLFELFTPGDTQAFEKLFRQPGASIDFRQYSKTHHPEIRYDDFSFRKLLEP